MPLPSSPGQLVDNKFYKFDSLWGECAFVVIRTLNPFSGFR